MNELTLKVEVRDLDIKIGKIKWSDNLNEVDYDIPKNQVIDEENGVHLIGLQYYDYSMFILLIEVSNPSHDSRFYLVDSEKLDLKNEASVYLPEIESPKKFNELARRYIEGGKSA